MKQSLFRRGSEAELSGLRSATAIAIHAQRQTLQQPQTCPEIAGPGVVCTARRLPHMQLSLGMHPCPAPALHAPAKTPGSPDSVGTTMPSRLWRCRHAQLSDFD